MTDTFVTDRTHPTERCEIRLLVPRSVSERAQRDPTLLSVFLTGRAFRTAIGNAYIGYIVNTRTGRDRPEDYDLQERFAYSLDAWVDQSLPSQALLAEYERYLAARGNYHWHGVRYGISAVSVRLQMEDLSHYESFSGTRQVRQVVQGGYIEITMLAEAMPGEIMQATAFDLRSLTRVAEPPADAMAPPAPPAAAPAPSWGRRLRFRRPD